MLITSNLLALLLWANVGINMWGQGWQDNNDVANIDITIHESGTQCLHPIAR